MAKLRIFVSSTCYDLSTLRSELRPFIAQMGYEPVMSEYSDILYDPRTHTHESCIKEVPSADAVILIIGSRFGGLALPSAILNVNFEQVKTLSTKTALLDNRDQLSVTQLEILKAIEQGIPIYAFVEERVLHDHNVYEKNKGNKNIIDQIDFPSIQKRESAKYIFEFINFLSHRITNNSIIGFVSLDEIRSHLVLQWSQLFQRLLMESRTRAKEERRYRDFSESIQELKAAVLASISTPGLQETAKGAIQFRRVIAFLSALRMRDLRRTLLSDKPWAALLEEAGIVRVLTAEENDRFGRMTTYLIKADGTFYRMRMPVRLLEDYRLDWENFVRLEPKSREAIVGALLEDREGRRSGIFPIQYFDRNIDQFLEGQQGPTNLGLMDDIETPSEQTGTPSEHSA